MKVFREVKSVTYRGSSENPFWLEEVKYFLYSWASKRNHPRLRLLKVERIIEKVPSLIPRGIGWPKIG